MIASPPANAGSTASAPPRSRARCSSKRTCPNLPLVDRLPLHPSLHRVQELPAGPGSCDSDLPCADGVTEIHIPEWQVAKGSSDPGTIDSTSRHPDRMVFDLDPGPGRGLADCVEVAQLVENCHRNELGRLPGDQRLQRNPPLCAARRHCNESASSDVAHELARSLESDHKDLVVSAMKKTLRENKVLIDWSQNSAAKTTVAPYSLRGRFTPTVAAPRTWDELDDPDTIEQLRFEGPGARQDAPTTSATCSNRWRKLRGSRRTHRSPRQHPATAWTSTDRSVTKTHQ